MNWYNVIDEVEALYATMDAHRIADRLSSKYGETVTHCDVRAALSRFVIHDTKRDATRRKVVMYAVRYRYGFEKIASLCDAHVHHVRNILKAEHPALFRSMDRDERDRKRATRLHLMRLSIEHIAEALKRGKAFVTKVVKALYVQLELPLFTDQQLLAA